MFFALFLSVFFTILRTVCKQILNGFFRILLDLLSDDPARAIKWMKKENSPKKGSHISLFHLLFEMLCSDSPSSQRSRSFGDAGSGTV